MSNILIIKHGSLGDIAQISGVLKDIQLNFIDKKIFILTTTPYTELLSSCPYLDGVLIDKRFPRWNIYYLYKLKKMLEKYNFSHVFDLQNSKRTSFYRKYLLKAAIWSSTETILKKGERKEDFDNDSVLERFKIQLSSSNIKTNYTLKPDFSWACSNVDTLLNQFIGKNFLIIFPFCSPQLSHKKWPYFNELIEIIKNKYKDEYKILIAPGPDEIDQSKQMNAECILDEGVPLDISKLSSLIKNSIFVVTNDTGPAHMAAHLSVKGIALFGSHTTAHKVSIERKNFKAIQVSDLKKLSAEKVFERILL